MRPAPIDKDIAVAIARMSDSEDATKALEHLVFENGFCEEHVDRLIAIAKEMYVLICARRVWRGR